MTPPYLDVAEAGTHTEPIMNSMVICHSHGDGTVVCRPIRPRYATLRCVDLTRLHSRTTLWMCELTPSAIHLIACYYAQSEGNASSFSALHGGDMLLSLLYMEETYCFLFSTWRRHALFPPSFEGELPALSVCVQIEQHLSCVR